MASYPPAEKASTAGDSGVLATTCHGLRVANEQLREVNREICRLTVARMMYFPSGSELPDRLLDREYEKYKRESFGDCDIFVSEWWKRATRNCLLESVGNLDRELEKTKTSRTGFESIQSALRCHIDKLSRPYLRNLSLLDLPDEILLMILERVENLDFDLREDIKNIRLVCRRLCNLSSQFLLRLVRVNLSGPSLARLEEISRHPTIAKGVRVIQIGLHFYNVSFTDLDWFISYLADTLEDQVNLSEGVKLWEFSNTHEETALEMIANGRAAVLALRRLVSTYHGEHFEEDEGRRARLDEIYSEYLILLEEQQSLVWSGRFSQAVGSAIARMPGARRLDFDDSDFQLLEAQRLMTPDDDVWNALYRLMLQPITGYQAKTRGLPLPNYQCIANTIAAVLSACTSLNIIHIKLSTLGHPGSLVPSPDIRREFSSGIQQLVEFEFKCTDRPGEQDADDLNEFLSLCLDTPSLQKLSLDMAGEEVGEAESRRIDVGQIMGSRSRDKLTNILFGQVALGFSGMVYFLNRLPQSMTCLHQRDIRLLSGTWKEALDALRNKPCRVMLLTEPHGAECDDMSREDYERIFGEDENHGCSTPAEFYIANQIPHQRNPLQDLEDGL